MQQFKLLTRGVFTFCVLVAGAAAHAQLLPEPQSVPVRFFGPAAADAQRHLVGRGVVLDGSGKPAGNPAKAFAPCGGGEAEIVWREVQRDVDPQGGMHVTYRQHLAGGGLDAELFGSAIGVHYAPDGKLAAVSGRQFDSVTVGGCASLSASEAAARAQERVFASKSQPGARAAAAKLKLVQIDGVFRPAWFTMAEDAEGEPQEVVVDADDGRMVASWSAVHGANCAPSNTSYVSATGIPVRPELSANTAKWRGMKAGPVTRGSFTHEGVWEPTFPRTVACPPSPQPCPPEPLRLIVYHGTGDATYACPVGSITMKYTVFPLRIDPAVLAVPVYDNIGTTWYGREAGDALWSAYKTMYAFRDLGRKGWDDLNGDARILVRHAGTDASESAQWKPTATDLTPAQTVMIRTPRRMYSLAASLDVVAHEFGHGLIEKSKNFAGTVNANEFHEGWSDVIGMLVEKKMQPYGTGLEQSSDWTMHEDSAITGYARGAIDDDADGIAGHEWVGINYTRDGSGGTTNKYWFNDRLHKDDTATDGSFHSAGNMLNVAYFIMAAGGSSELPSGLNPICARLPLNGCEASNQMKASPAEYLGTAKAGALLFYALQFTLQTSTTWFDVANRVMEAAFLRYNTCQSATPYNAAGEQNAVRKAFAGIGYPTSYTSNIPCN